MSSDPCAPWRGTIGGGVVSGTKGAVVPCAIHTTRPPTHDEVVAERDRLRRELTSFAGFVATGVTLCSAHRTRDPSCVVCNALDIGAVMLERDRLRAELAEAVGLLADACDRLHSLHGYPCNAKARAFLARVKDELGDAPVIRDVSGDGTGDEP
jgi:hypothetical protein